MKLCWDTLNKLKYNRKTDRWHKNGASYVYKNYCKACNEPFLARVEKGKKGWGEFCSRSCATTGKFNGFYKKTHTEELIKKMIIAKTGTKHTEETKKKMSGKNHPNYGKPRSEETKRRMSKALKGKNWICGKHHSEETKKKMSKSHKGKTLTEEHRRKISVAISGKNNHMFGKHHSEERKKQISIANSGENGPMYGKHHTEEAKRKLRESQLGEKSTQWDGGYNSKGIPKYDTYAHQIEWCEEVRRNKEDRNILEVQCFKCGKWYVSTVYQIRNRIDALNSEKGGVSHFYCSDTCKHTCSVFYKTAKSLMKQDAINAGRLNWQHLNREVQPELRQLVIEADGYKCVKCNSTEDSLHCHHIYPVSMDPLESADVNNCMMVCKDCHIEIHQKDGCGPIQCVEYY
jgi:hypothetical protein